MDKNILRKTPAACLGAVFCCALWGSAFPFIKTGYAVLSIGASDWASQILFAGIRFTLAGVLTLVFGSVLSKKILVPKIESISKIAVLALFQTILQYVFFYIGLAYTTGTKSSVINSAGVFFAVLIASLVFKQEKLTASKIIGCIIGFAGVIIVNIDGGLGGEMSFFGDGFILFSALSYAFSSAFIKRFSEYENPVVLSGYQFTAGGMIMAVLGFACGGRFESFNVKGALILLYLAAVSAVAYTLWGVLLKYNSVSKVAVFGFMTPVFGFVLSVLILNESIVQSEIKMLSALILVCLGIFIVNKTKRKSL